MAFTNTHQQCDKCGSSDAVGVNEDGSTKCFSCDSYNRSGSNPPQIKKENKKQMETNFIQGKPEQIPRRNLTVETCQKWGYHTAMYNGEPVQVANYKSRNGTLVGQKIRTATKQFHIKGELMGLYGQHLWKDGGKRVVVCEGEIDALSISQAFGNKWAVASVPNGAGGAKKYISQAIDWLESFEKVIFCFDNDDVGRRGALGCAALLTPGKASIAELPLKDASDMIVAKRSEELVNCLWQAREYRPDGIVGGEEIWQAVIKEDTSECQPYPYAALNAMTHGIRRGELVTICAGSGIGKSLFCREVCHHLLELGETVGYIALEESVRRTALGIMGIHVNKPLHLENDLSEKELRKAFDETMGDKKFYTYDHFGSTESDNLLNKIKYLCKGLGCKWIFLDHLSIVVSGIQGDDERRLIDNTMTSLRSLVEETGCGMILVSHLRRPPNGGGHEEGGVTRLSDLRGSHSIPQLSDMVIGLERNQQKEDSTETKIRVLKNRFSGETGLATSLFYNADSGRYTESEDVFKDKAITNNGNDPF
tara:strand:+ start:1069 stop:2676 length:1608 start_codon:yes stop_codon:yes gene_type:complete